MEKRENIVFIATSIDGYIADKEGGISYLEMVPNPEQNDMGYGKLMERVDALVMGRNTYEKVLSFGIGWPYTKPVYILSNTLESVPQEFQYKVELVKGSLEEVLEQMHAKGHHKLYIDGGKVIQQFLSEDLIDEMILTTIPILLGGGVPLFAHLPKELPFELKESKVFLGEVTRRTYIRKRELKNDS
ncbi:dihydrofolate reductase [Lentimicrobium sp. L6]|uniref:dihydrofolate reductase family protein n=1 Tax=Lentimicrobium sp. L6 TaxID=2735916 RepID=UPI001555DB0C|nr:dihydrofolate reductase family protein [Lentimicrobium sp. L6]NPD84104.1 dihydrofolate reductase [Lentimicrobium sp. L6]